MQDIEHKELVSNKNSLLNLRTPRGEMWDLWIPYSSQGKALESLKVEILLSYYNLKMVKKCMENASQDVEMFSFSILDQTLLERTNGLLKNIWTS